MADDNKLWFEMGVRDKVTENLTNIMSKAASVKKEMDAITASESAVYQNAAKLEQIYDKIGIALQRISDARSKATKGEDMAKLNQMESKIKEMRSVFKELENNQAKMGLKGSVALETLKQGFQLMTTQVARYASEIEKTSSKEAKAHDEEIRRQDKLKSKLYELQTLRKKLSDNILSAGPGVDTSAASKIAGQLWQKEMQVHAYMKNGRDLPLDFFGADYNEMRRKAEEYSRIISGQVAQAQREAAAAADLNAKANRNLVSTYDKVIEKGKGTYRILDQIAAQWASAISLYSAEHLLKSVIQVGGEFEQQHIALQNILGDIEEANTLFGQMQTLAVVSPFNFRQLTSYTKQTAAYGIPYEELYDTTKRLADLSAGLGVDMGRLILAYGQVRSASVLRGQELRQFTEAGIPLVQKLADKFTALNGRLVTTGEVFELISKRKVPFEMVKDILWDMTDAGGSFYQMQFKLSDTLLGKWSNLQDAWEIMLSKFAESGSTGGDALKTLVQWTTDLIESLDRLSPVIKGVMGGYAITKFAKLATGDILNTSKAILDAKKLEASRLRRESLTRQLSEREREILLTSNKITANDVQALASAGRLNTLKLQQLYLSKQITQSDVARLVNEKAITVEQGAQIVNATRLKLLWGSLRSTVGGFLSGMWQMMTSPQMMLTAGVGAALALYSSWKEANEEQEAIAKKTGDSIVDQYNRILGVQQEVGKAKPVSDGDFLKGITDITDALKSVGAYTPEIDMQSQSIEDLGKRYSYLRDRLDEVVVAYKNLSEHAGASTQFAIEATDGWFDESIVTNMKDLTRTMENYDKAAIGVQRFGAIIQAEIDRFANFDGNEALKNQLDGKSLEEQLKIIAETPYWQSIQNMVGQTSSKAREALENFNEEYFEVLSDWKTITDTDLPEFIQGIEDSFKREHPDIDLTNLDEAMKVELKRFVHQALTEVDGVRQDIKDRLEQDIDAHFKINVDFELTLPTPPDYWRVQYPVLNQLYGRLSDKGIGRDNEFYQELGKNAGSSESLWKYMDKQVDDLKTAWQAEEKLYGEASDQAQKAKTQYDNMKEARDAVFGGSQKGKKDGGTGSKKDTELESIKNRVELYKKFFAEYENAKKLYGNQGGLDFLKSNGFGAVFGWGLSDVTNYSESLNEIVKSLSNTSEARDKFINSVDSDKVTQQRKTETESLREYVSELQRMMSVMSENYQTYKKWYDLTGDSDLASRVAGVAKNTTYSDWLKDEMTKALAGVNSTKSASEVFGFTKKELDDAFGENSAIRTFWEEWQKNERKIKSENLSLYENAIKDAKGYEEKIADINRELEKEITAIGLLAITEEERQRLIKNVTNNADRKISSIKWDQFKDENDWGRVFGNLDNMQLQSIKKMIGAMKEYAKTTKMDVTETKAWYEALEKLTDKKTILDPLGSIVEAVKNYQAAHNKRKIIEEQIERTKNNPELSEDKKKKILNKLDKTRNQLLDEETAELIKASKAIKSFSNNIGKLGSSLQQLGDSIGGNFGDFINGVGGMLGDLSNGMSSVGDLAQAMSQKGFSGAIGKVSAAIGIISSTISMVQKLDSILPSSESIYEKYAERQRKINQMREALEDYEIEALKRQQRNQNWLYSNGLSEMRSNGYIRQNLLRNYANTQLAPQEIYQDARSGFSKWAPAIIGAIVAIVVTAVTWGLGSAGGAALGSGIAAALGSAGTAAVGAAVAAGAGAAIGTALRSVGDQIFYKEGQTAARNNLRVQTRHKTFFRSEKTQNLEEWVRENWGKELFDKNNYDLIDVELAKKILDDGPTLVGETRETLERLVEIAEQIQEIQDQIHDYVGQMFSPLIDNMTDSLWDWLKNGTNMLDSFHDYASDTFANIAKDAVKSFLKINLLDKYTKNLEDIFNAYSFGLYSETELMLGVAHVAGEIGASFEALAPILEELGKVLEVAFKEQGYDIVNGSDRNSSSSANSLKSLTESTGDIIAGYVNAIRADVSVDRAMLAQYYPLFLSALTQNNVIANAQLEQMKIIADNTGRNVGLVQDIYDILNKNVLGANKFHI